MPVKNTHYLDVDTKLTNYISVPRVTQNDDVFFIVRILDDGRPVSLTSVQTFLLASLKPNKETILTVGTVSGDEISFKIESAALNVKGRVQAAVQLYYTDGRTSTIPFYYEVIADNSVDYVPDTSETSLIQLVLGDAPFVIEAAQSATIGAEDAAAQTLEALDNFDTEKSVAIQELDVVKEENKTNWKQEVATVALRDSTYPNPQSGDTVRITGEARIDRFNGTEWVTTDRYNPAVVDELTVKLADIPELANTFGSQNEVRFIAHRGLSLLAPENTIPAYEMAGRAGFWGAETDVTVTSDGHWVLMHDATVDRTTNGTGNVSDLTLEQIKSFKVDAGNGFSRFPNLQVPTMDEFLATCKKFNLVPVIEIKTASKASDYDTFVSLIKNNGFEEKCIVISFSTAALQEVRSRSTKIMLQAIVSITESNLLLIRSLGNASIDVNAGEVTKELVELAHSYGVLVNVWTVNNYQDARKVIEYGVDFITTDFISGGVI